MASYSESFKRNAVEFLNDLRNKGKFQLNNIDITNIRELCVFLDISTQTLYAWEKRYSGLKSQKNDDSDKNEFKKKMVKAYENGDEHESESDKILGDKKIRNGKYKQFKPQVEKELLGFLTLPVEKKSKSTGDQKEIFNQRYYGWFAGMLGIKYYSNMLVPQLKLAIGNELIRQSGLIDMNKASEKLSQNGEKL